MRKVPGSTHKEIMWNGTSSVTGNVINLGINEIGVRDRPGALTLLQKTNAFTLFRALTGAKLFARLVNDIDVTSIDKQRPSKRTDILDVISEITGFIRIDLVQYTLASIL